MSTIGNEQKIIDLLAADGIILNGQIKHAILTDVFTIKINKFFNEEVNKLLLDMCKLFDRFDKIETRQALAGADQSTDLKQEKDDIMTTIIYCKNRLKKSKFWE